MRRSTTLFGFFLLAGFVHLGVLRSRLLQAAWTAGSDLPADAAASPDRVLNGYTAVLVLLAVIVPLLAWLLPGTPAGRFRLLDPDSRSEPPSPAEMDRRVRDALLVSGAAMAFFFSVLVELQFRAASRGESVEGGPGPAVVHLAAIAFAVLVTIVLRSPRNRSRN